MANFNLHESSFVVSESATLEEAMVAITLNQRGAVIVLNGKGIFMGIVADGDIRRLLLQHATMMSPAIKALNMNALILSNNEDVEKRSQDIFKEKADVNIIPVVDKNNALVDVIVRNPGVRKDL